ncbi:MAG: T9SS type A sorting domain-containing protein, partial [Candidatus Cloacimonetes bacterium]|nr:T9SS type A sorting domain-containing protein [Candidatus Cloacimonadota bacterium]
NSYEVHDDNNNIPEYNEIITLDVTFENVGIEAALNVNATLSTDDTYVNITSDYIEIGDIAAGATVTIQDAFEIEVADNIPDQYMIIFDVEIVGSDTWNSNINITFNAPAFEIGDMIINDSGGNGLLDPGETATLSVPLTNIGHATSQDIAALLVNGSPDIITMINDSFNLTGLAPEEEGYAEFNIEVNSSAEPGSIAILDFIATSGGYNLSNTFYLTIGLAVEDFETGDFSNYSWVFGGNADWQITDLEVYEGVYSAKSGTINHNQITSMIITLDVLCDSEISFYRKTSCEDVGSVSGNYYDYLVFFIDGEEMDKWAGETPWGQVIFEVSAGDHTFEWMYHKDVGEVGGQDCVWVDYILFPPFEPEVSTDDMSVIPSIIKLCGNYPNPFNPETNISFSLKADSKVVLEIFNIKGQKIRTLVNNNMNAGFYNVVWNGKDNNNRNVASGIYFYKMKAGGRYTSTRKMILMK